MKRNRVILSLLLFGSLAAPSPAEEGAGERLNVLFIAVDDLKPLLGAFGEGLVQSPHIDRLASRGTVFKLNYCQQAVCAPSRTSLLTGLRPDRTRVWDLKTLMRDRVPDIVTLPQYFKQNGYVSVGIGKIFDFRSVDRKQDEVSWSLPYLNWQDGLHSDFEQPVLSHYQDPRVRENARRLEREAITSGIPAAERRDFIKARTGWATESIQVPDDAYRDGAIAKMAAHQLEELAQGKRPFFFAVGFSKPHLPFVAPKKYWDLYDPAELPLASYQRFSNGGPVVAYHRAGELSSYAGIPALERLEDHVELLPEEVQRRLIHGYYACVSYIDRQIGRLLEKLQELDMLDRTIIVLWGDHGWHLGDHSLWCKHSNFEQATRSPLLISAPGMRGGHQFRNPTEFVDIFPTLCELTGLEIPPQLDGVSLVKVLQGSEVPVKPYAVSQYPRGSTEGYALRTRRYRYVEWVEGGFKTFRAFDADRVVAVELYDLINDPEESRNLATDPGLESTRKDLAGQLHDFFESEYQKSRR